MTEVAAGAQAPAATLYNALYMAAVRTQVYLTAQQRERLDELAKRDGRSLASHIREALDQYLGEGAVEPEAALDTTFGAIKGLEVPPRDEWRRG